MCAKWRFENERCAKGPKRAKEQVRLASLNFYHQTRGRGTGLLEIKLCRFHLQDMITEKNKLKPTRTILW